MQSNKTTIIITTAILILTLLTAGCTDTGGANPETVKYTPPPQEVAVVEEMETIDLDQDGAMDKVAVKYVGTDGVGEFITDYDGWDSVGHYISMGIYYDLFN